VPMMLSRASDKITRPATVPRNAQPGNSRRRPRRPLTDANTPEVPFRHLVARRPLMRAVQLGGRTKAPPRASSNRSRRNYGAISGTFQTATNCARQPRPYSISPCPRLLRLARYPSVRLLEAVAEGGEESDGGVAAAAGDRLCGLPGRQRGAESGVTRVVDPQVPCGSWEREQIGAPSPSGARPAIVRRAWFQAPGD